MNINLCLFVYKSKLKKASKNKTKDRYFLKLSIEMVILFDLKIDKSLKILFYTYYLKIEFNLGLNVFPILKINNILIIIK